MKTLVSAAVVALAAASAAGDLGTFEIREPLGRDWSGEWIIREVTIDAGDGVRAGDLQVEAEEPADGDTPKQRRALPTQFYEAATGTLLEPQATLRGRAKLKALFAAVLAKDAVNRFYVTGRRKDYWALTPEQRAGRDAWQPLDIVDDRGGWRISTGFEGIFFIEEDSLTPFSTVFHVGGRPLASLSWSDGVKPTGVKNEWLERGPARAILRRTFTFADPKQRYSVRFTFRAGDPWIDVVDEYALGRGTHLKLALGALNADVVHHPYAYNARTFKPGGAAEDSTLQPPQHPIATLGPIWRDIWFGGGPWAFIYRRPAVSPPEGADEKQIRQLTRQAEDAPRNLGLGFAAVRGSLWQSPDEVPLESQNLFVHGDREKEGRIWVELPTDAGTRHWALVIGPVSTRHRMDDLVRARADVPLQKVLDEWIVQWDSRAEKVDYPFAWQWFGPYNRHTLNPTTFPRTAGKWLGGKLREGKTLHSRDLAMLAYAFEDPNYWPGPKYRWQIGNPNFNTDMYSIVLQAGLLMPDHPHARRWVEHGLNELKTNVYRDSFPGGAWAESLSYSGFFFHIAEYAHLIQKAGVANPFADWPRLKEVYTYLASMHGPVDPRYGTRQKAPIGDTSPGNYIRQIRAGAAYYKGVDDAFARKLATFGEKTEGGFDLASREFYGFGAALRANAWDDRHESFVTFKAGPARNHFQGDELSLTFHGLGTPLAIDYACHYSPRPWHAAMHNRPDMNDKRPAAVAARRGFAATPVADVFVADERTRRINHVPLTPHETAKPGWEYPWTTLPEESPWTMRRWAMLVKHDPKASKIPDYLVIRDEIDAPEAVWWNLHVLGHGIEQDGGVFRFPGQLDVDLTAHVLTPRVRTVQKRIWGWGDHEDRGARKGYKGDQYEQAFFGRVLPKDFERGTWGRPWQRSGEVGQWLRVQGDAGRTDWLVVLMPTRQGQPAAKVERLSPTSARITLGDEAEVIHLGTEAKHQAAVERGGRTTVLLEAGRVKPWSDVEFTPAPPLDQGAL